VVDAEVVEEVVGVVVEEVVGVVVEEAVVEVEDICIGSDAGVMGDGIECLQYGGICGLLFGLLHAIVKEDALLMDVLFQAQDLMIVCGQRIVIVVEQIIIHELKKRH
jgi:hypothetical protein